MVPFEVTIPPERRDLHLVEKLEVERDGILGWMLKGCHEWQRIGLCPPDIIRNAVADYIADEDMVGQWIAARCVTDASARAASGALFASWGSFADLAGIPKGSQKSLSEALRQKGFKSNRTATQRGWTGITLPTSAEVGQ